MPVAITAANITKPDIKAAVDENGDYITEAQGVYDQWLADYCIDEADAADPVAIDVTNTLRFYVNARVSDDNTGNDLRQIADSVVIDPYEIQAIRYWKQYHKALLRLSRDKLLSGNKYPGRIFRS
ncbi:MAG: hypothetical protein KAS32_22410 [Candidatus Peribacteraceae bacterium]|nr:hypothetical protein [Candidatus Peribacteraceae bacterium]